MSTFDASEAPRGQLPYIIDDVETVDSNTIIAYLTNNYHLTLDDGLTGAQRDLNHLITRMLDDLYWVTSHSRWKDERYWPTFRDALLSQKPSLSESDLLAFARGLADLQVLANLIPAEGYMHGPKPTSIDADIYGFIANIYFYDIDTHLTRFVMAHQNIVHHCKAIHAAVMSAMPVTDGDKGSL